MYLHEARLKGVQRTRLKFTRFWLVVLAIILGRPARFQSNSDRNLSQKTGVPRATMSAFHRQHSGDFSVCDAGNLEALWRSEQSGVGSCFDPNRQEPNPAIRRRNLPITPRVELTKGPHLTSPESGASQRLDKTSSSQGTGTGTVVRATDPNHCAGVWIRGCVAGTEAPVNCEASRRTSSWIHKRQKKGA